MIFTQTMIKKYFNVFAYIVVIGYFSNDLYQDFMFFDYEFELSWKFHIEVFCTLLIFYLLAQQIYVIRQSHKKLANASTVIRNLQGDITTYIEHKFKIWKLSDAEKEVSWLVLKGFSFKEISDIRNVSEKTIHQQSSSIYRKSNSKNRHALISGFMEEFIHLEHR